MTIRDATIADIELIFHIRCAAREKHLSREQLACIGVTPKSVAAMISGGDYVVPIVEKNGQAVAFAMAQISQGYVFALFVLPGHENLGYGKAALRRVEEELRRIGIRRAWLSTGRTETLRAHGFYRHLGWTHSGFLSDGQARYERELA